MPRVRSLNLNSKNSLTLYYPTNSVKRLISITTETTTSRRFPLAQWLQRLGEVLARHRFLVALCSLTLGVLSYVLVERQPILGAWLTLGLAGSWLVILAEGIWSTISSTERQRLAGGALKYVMQSLHQEALFFVIPFLLAATVWHHWNAGFTIVVIALAVISIIDPMYHGLVARSRSAWLGIHALTLFVSCLVCLPLLLKIPAGETLAVAIPVAMFAAIPSFWQLTSGGSFKRLIILILLTGSLAAAAWYGRAGIPAPAFVVRDAAVSMQFDRTDKAPIKPQTIFTEAEIRNGLYAFSAIRAPSGMGQGIRHEWRLNGMLVDSIPMEIHGGRESGYRAWSHKNNFPPYPKGSWRVDVRTADGQLLERIRFDVIQ